MQEMLWKRISTLSRRDLLQIARRHYQQQANQDIIRLRDATFYRNHPSSTDTNESNPALFPGLSFSLPVSKDPQSGEPQYWAIISPSSQARTAFLQVLGAQHLCLPPNARTYPHLVDISTPPEQAIKYVGFDAERGNTVGGTSLRGSYLSARYESRREITDFSLRDYLTGHTELNALETETTEDDRRLLEAAVAQLKLEKLLEMPVANLSNGQTRRARIARALMTQPEVLLLDGPYMGLDPNTLLTMDTVLRQLAEAQKPRIIMSLRPEDGIPEWISHIVLADGQLKAVAQGPKSSVFSAANRQDSSIGPILHAIEHSQNTGDTVQVSRDGFSKDSPALPAGEALVEMQGVKVSYGDTTVLGDWEQDVNGEKKPGLWWTLRRGQRCGIFGPNGSGKTTMLSLITSDHPQTYSLPIKLFGRSRLPEPGEPGISVFDLQRRMGHSSPEVHAYFPRQLTVRAALESAWADAPLARPVLTAAADRRVDAALRWFAPELRPLQPSPSIPTATDEEQRDPIAALERAYHDPYIPPPPTDGRVARFSPAPAPVESVEEVYTRLFVAGGDEDLLWADDARFGGLSFSNQRLVLFLRAILASPDLVILDEALSGMDEGVRDKALRFLAHGETVVGVEPEGAAAAAAASPSPASTTGTESKPAAPAPATRLSVLARLGKVCFAGLQDEQALLVISHAKEDVPGAVREWICLPEPGEGRAPRSGTLPGPLELNPGSWGEIWGR